MNELKTYFAILISAHCQVFANPVLSVIISFVLSSQFILNRSLLFGSQIAVFSSLPGLLSFSSSHWNNLWCWIFSFEKQLWKLISAFCFSSSSGPPVTANLILFNCGRTRIKIINADRNILPFPTLQSLSLNRLQISWFSSAWLTLLITDLANLVWLDWSKHIRNGEQFPRFKSNFRDRSL